MIAGQAKEALRTKTCYSTGEGCDLSKDALLYNQKLAKKILEGHYPGLITAQDLKLRADKIILSVGQDKKETNN